MDGPPSRQEVTRVETESRPKVLFLAPQPFFQWRGSPIRVGFNVRALAELGYEVDLLAMPVGQDHDLPGVRLLRVPNVLGVRALPIGPSPAKAVFDAVLFLCAFRMCRRRRYAVIHGVEEAGAMAAVLARWFAARSVFEKHSDPASYRRGPVRNAVMWMYARVEHFAVRHADAVIATGPALAEQARAAGAKGDVHHIFDIPSSRVEAAADRVAAVRARFAGGAETLLVMYVGSFAVYQGIDLMFEAMASVLRERPEVRFIVIGGSPVEIAERRAWMEARGVGAQGVFPGKVPPDELPDYLAAADVLLSPRAAGANTPLKLLDYLKAGRAVVATDHPANRLILDSSCSLLVEAAPERFANGVKQLLGDPQLRERLGRAGRRRIEQTYHNAEFKRRLGACYAALGAPQNR
jgi:glycosyltransferase involved in cell wall biosynthesis